MIDDDRGLKRLEVSNRTRDTLGTQLYAGDALVRLARIPNNDSDLVLFPEEQASIARAVPKRRLEFATGRVLARSLLSELGLDPGPIAPREDRTPRWPDSVVGSISHTNCWCIVAVARRKTCLSLGIDIERSRIGAHLWPKLFTETETRWIEEDPTQTRVRSALLFSAKESVYKCQYPVTKAFLEHHDVEVEVDEPRRTFSARIRRQMPDNFNPIINGHFVTDETFVITSSILRRKETEENPSEP